MYIFNVRFKYNNYNSEISNLVNLLLHSWRQNGQILGRTQIVTVKSNYINATGYCLEKKSLDQKYNNVYSNNHIKSLAELNVTHEITVDKDLEDNGICNCKNNKFILYTHYVAINSPIICLNCGKPKPLYHFPKTYDNTDYNDIINWESDYQSCDSLQMNCVVGERFAINQMKSISSPLFTKGLNICNKLKNLTNKDFFYYRFSMDLKSKFCKKCGTEYDFFESSLKFIDRICYKCNIVE